MTDFDQQLKEILASLSQYTNFAPDQIFKEQPEFLEAFEAITSLTRGIVPEPIKRFADDEYELGSDAVKGYNKAIQEVLAALPAKDKS